MSSEPGLEKKAEETTELLAKAYRLQDELEGLNSLEEKRSDPRADKAYDAMGRVWAREFSGREDIDLKGAYEAGWHHMNALFKQDVVENDERHRDVDGNIDSEEVLGDERWEKDVYDSLVMAADSIGLPDDWAWNMKGFLKGHGQEVEGLRGNPNIKIGSYGREPENWEAYAFEARKRIVEHATGTDYDDLKQEYGDLARDFPEGVKHHDKRDWNKAKEVIAGHYKKLFQENGYVE